MSRPIYAKTFNCEIEGCWTCKENYLDEAEQQSERLAYIKQINDRAARDIIKADAAAIDESWKHIQQQIKESGDALLRAWKNATTAKRVDLLRKAWNKTESPSPIAWEGLRRQNALATEEANKAKAMFTRRASPTLANRQTYRNSLLLPYVIPQALAHDDRILLCLLQNRNEYAPAAWATLDLQLTFFGRKSGLLEREFNGTCFYISDTKAVYGAPMLYKSGLFHEPGTLVGFPNAQILFEAQRKLYTFLRAVVVDILKSRKDRDTGNAKWLEGARSMSSRDQQLLPLDDMGIGQAASRHVCCQPYSLQSLAESIKLSARRRQQDAELELLTLQRDPEYMRLRVIHLRDNSHYRVLKVEERWQELALDVWAPIFRRVWIWDYIALWAGVLVEHKNNDVARVLHFLLQMSAEDYAIIFADILVKDDVFIGQLKKLHGKKKEILTVNEKLEAAERVDSDQMARDGLFWAVSNLSNYKAPVREDGPQKLPLAEIMAVAASAILEKDERQRQALSDAQILPMIDDLAALSCMRSTLERSPGFQQFGSFQAYSQANEKYSPLLRPDAGGHYANITGEWTDVFAPEPLSEDFRKDSLRTAGGLLKEFTSSRPPQWSHHDLFAQWKQAENLRLQLDEFWKEMSKKRIAFLDEYTSCPMEDIEIQPDVTLMQQGYEDPADLILIRKNIAAQEIAQAARSAGGKDKKRPERIAGTYAPFPNLPAPVRDRAKEAELSKRQSRIKEHEERREAARVAAGAEPTPVAPDLPPPDPIQVDATTLETIAWFWPYASQAHGSRMRVTWTKCVAALVKAGLNVAGINGSHYTFTGRDGSMSIPAPHGGHDAPMSDRRLGWLGDRCTRDLRWSWDTFDPNFEGGDPDPDDGGDVDGGDGGDAAG